jgi:hypothetical protein
MVAVNQPPPTVYVIVGPAGNLGGWHSTPSLLGRTRVECVEAFTSEADALAWLLDGSGLRDSVQASHETAMRHAWRVVKMEPSE